MLLAWVVGAWMMIAVVGTVAGQTAAGVAPGWNSGWVLEAGAAPPRVGNDPLTVIASINPPYTTMANSKSFVANVTLNATVTGGTGPYRFDWDFGDGSRNSSKPSVDHIYATSGEYLVRLTVVDHNGSLATSTVIARPVVPVAGNWFAISASETFGAAPLTVDFGSEMAGGGNDITGMNWSFGDGGASSELRPSHTYARPGVYLTQAVATFADGGQNEFVFTIVAGAVGALTARAQAVVIGHCLCDGSRYVGATLHADVESGTGPYTYAWSYGDGNGSSGSNPVDYLYPNLGEYTATATVVDENGTVATASVSLEIGPVLCPFPLPRISNLTSNATRGPVPLSVSFHVNVSCGVGPLAFAWDFGDGGTGNRQNTSHVFTTAGNYTVVFTVTDGYGLRVNASLRITALPASNGSGTGPPGGNGSGTGPPSGDGASPVPSGGTPPMVFAAAVSAVVILAAVAGLYVWRRRGKSRR